MKNFLPKDFMLLVSGILLLFASGPVSAGGLVDTSAERFATTDFTTNPSEDITNRWWTLPAGENFLYFAEEDDECAWNLIEVLPMTTDNFFGVYADTDARIILDREWIDEECEYDNFADVAANLEPEESTYDWYAQDIDGNVWYMGEDTWDGDSGGSFVAGCDGAEAGIVILGEPEKGLFHRQEFYAGEAEDWGKVLNFVEIDDLECMKSKEWAGVEPGHVEHKFYCSDGEFGELALINELKGKTVVVELFATGVASPAGPDAPINPIPQCDD